MERAITGRRSGAKASDPGRTLGIWMALEYSNAIARRAEGEQLAMSRNLIQTQLGADAGRRAQRRPPWIRIRAASGSSGYRETHRLMRSLRLNTILR